MDIDQVAGELISGKRTCIDCPDLAQYVEQVRNNEMNMEDFKRMLRASGTKKLSQTL